MKQAPKDKARWSRDGAALANQCPQILDHAAVDGILALFVIAGRVAEPSPGCHLTVGTGSVHWAQ
jgi:hypothetical protein